MKRADIFLTGDAEKDTRRVTYLIFITAVSVLSLIVAALYYIIRDEYIRQVLFVLDFVYALVFLVDFVLRLRAVSDRRYYMLHWGWLDLVTSIPGIPALRIIRSLNVLRHAREISEMTPDEIEDEARSRLAESVLFVTVFVGLIVITIGSIGIVSVEANAPDAQITTGYDAVWWSLVTVSTVGYGDEYPVTGPGRIIGVFMIVVGVALFTTVTSYLASNFTGRDAQRQRDEQIQFARQHAEQMEEMMKRLVSLEEQNARLLGSKDEGKSGNGKGSD